MTAPEVMIGEPDIDRWQPVSPSGQDDVEEVAPPAADEVAPPPPTPTPAAPGSATPVPATDTSSADTSSATATVTPAGHMLIGGASVATLGGIGLYNTVGVAGLAVGGATVVAGAGGYAYWR
ncbi:hypothetical protein GCM10017673_58390 [Streptosporangium violaceochromogenes]|nr:hypothetical protein GCM10017673_58390 [Streptosporangium violaceochromogenes]